MLNLTLLADAQRRRFEGSYEDFRAALDAAYANGTDVPTTGPSTDEPGGPGGTPPPDERIPTFDGTLSTYLARAQWAQQRVATWPSQKAVA